MNTRTKISWLVVLATAALSSAARAGDPDNPWKLGEPEFADVGAYKHIAKPIHKEHDEKKDHPLVRKIHPLWQEDQKYANLFAPSGSSMICGPTSLTMCLLWLKSDHKPPLEHVFKELKPGHKDVEALDHMFKVVHTDKVKGSTVKEVDDGWKKELENDGYKVSKEKSFVVDNDTKWPTRENLLFAQKEDRVGVLCFGWYHLTKDGDKWHAHRTGGHFVVLAGHDTQDKNAFYVTNPLTDYKQPDKVWFSKIDFEDYTVTHKILGFKTGTEHMLMTHDLVGGHVAILESVIVVSPE
jgi:hypothetical protein